MTGPGRPTLYKPHYAQQAHGHCLLGATNAELAGIFDVAPRTVDNWIANIPEFAMAVREGRAEADAKVACSLFQRAIGYRRTVERIVWHQGQERRLTSMVDMPPDTNACIFWLRNRRRDLWGGGKQQHRDDLLDDDLAILDAAGEEVRSRIER